MIFFLFCYEVTERLKARFDTSHQNFEVFQWALPQPDSLPNLNGGLPPPADGFPLATDSERINLAVATAVLVPFQIGCALLLCFPCLVLSLALFCCIEGQYIVIDATSKPLNNPIGVWAIVYNFFLSTHGNLLLCENIKTQAAAWVFLMFTQIWADSRQPTGSCLRCLCNHIQCHSCRM